MKRRTFIKNTGAAALSPMVKGMTASMAPPNIVLIVADDLGYGDLGCYGSHIQTPNLNLMASQGVQFQNFNSGNPVCSASRASILTGRYGVRCGVPAVFWPTDTGGLSTTEVTIAQMLKPAGYSTMCIGKWHLGTLPQFLPTTRGFDEYYGIPYSNDMAPSILMHNTDIIESPVDLTTITRRYTQQAVDFIRRSSQAPFFLYMPHTFPHIPLAASPDFTGQSGLGLYGDVVAEMDWSVGQVLGALQDSGLDQNTLVMFTSDHGPFYQGSPGRLRGRKGDTFEGGMRVPFLARFPGRIPAGAAQRGVPRIAGPRVVSATASALDILPTIAGFAHTPLPGNPLDGADIGPVLTGQAADVTHPLFLYFCNYSLQCARLGPWKLHMVRPNVPAFTAEPKVGFFNLRLLNPELYDVESDPEEAVDASGQNPAVVADIQQRVAQMLPALPPAVQADWNNTQSIPVYPNEPGSYPTPIVG
ncbi:MAG: sulfatase [Candidatus Sulfopaludibacter sp.]|nr:sulfatase [Candidatus Sulfopaludibacter sp.]